MEWPLPESLQVCRMAPACAHSQGYCVVLGWSSHFSSAQLNGKTAIVLHDLHKLWANCLRLGLINALVKSSCCPSSPCLPEPWPPGMLQDRSLRSTTINVPVGLQVLSLDSNQLSGTIAEGWQLPSSLQVCMWGIASQRTPLVLCCKIMLVPRHCSEIVGLLLEPVCQPRREAAHPARPSTCAQGLNLYNNQLGGTIPAGWQLPDGLQVQVGPSHRVLFACGVMRRCTGANALQPG